MNGANGTSRSTDVDGVGADGGSFGTTSVSVYRLKL